VAGRLLRVALLAALAATALAQERAPSRWTKLETEGGAGKQDDVFFVDSSTGLYVNGLGKIFKTRDGGKSWRRVIHKKGTYFRCLGFVDAAHGFAGNVGPGYFPGVTDTKWLYETVDGGETWKAVENLPGVEGKGLCALDIMMTSRGATVHAAGRIGGPPILLVSRDTRSWESLPVSSRCAMILDVKFFDEESGVLCAASDVELARSRALILVTADGGRTWREAYRSARPYEICWKCSFPTREVGYATVQSYDPAESNVKRFVAKTTDGGKTWTEELLVEDHACEEFGVAFVTGEHGWVGTMHTGYETQDGGRTWQPVAMGRAVNKIRFVPTEDGYVGYAVGVDVYKVTLHR
jgi:photosystem II stability/assembly factor-like uncharacterized protein